MLLDAAEGHERASARVVRRQPFFADKAFALHVDVKADLVVEARLGVAAGQQAQARAGGVKPTHAFPFL